MSAKRWLALASLLALRSAAPVAQTVPAARVAILQAEARGATDVRDLATLRSGVRNANAETARAAIRALGRLGRPTLVPDIAVALKSSLPEIRAAAADAIADALSGAPGSGSSETVTSPARSRATVQSSAPTAVATAHSILMARLGIEADPDVRAAICEALGRIPYTDAKQIQHAEALILTAPVADNVTDRLGIVKGLESLIRLNAERWSPSMPTIALLRALLGVIETPAADPTSTRETSLAALSQYAARPRDARVRRLAFEALLSAGAADAIVLDRAASDPDPQVRWLAMRAAGHATGAGSDAAAGILQAGRRDTAALVRAEALRGESLRAPDTTNRCRHFMESVHDPSMQVVLTATDLLGDCGSSADAVELLSHAASDLSTAAVLPRSWQLAAHALVALSHAAPDRAAAALGPFTASTIWPLRAYAARAAAVLGDRDTLLKLSSDENDEVATVGNEGLGRTVASRSATPADLKTEAAKITAADLQRLAAARARVSIRNVGTFDLALLTAEAPATVLRFVRLAEEHRYDGMTIAAVLPTRVDLTRQGETGLANEIGSWPHVRGTLSLSRESSDSGMVIDLVDNPQLDHRSPVFAQILNGIEVLDQLLEGDVIERIEILSRP